MENAQIVKELLLRMGFNDAEVTAYDLAGRVKIEIKTTSGREIIGEKGIMLTHFQHIARKIIAKKIGASIILDIDINNYKKMRENILRDFAKEMRDRVRLSGKAVELEPMPSSDRRIVHLTLAEFSDVTTESMGEGWNRYVVVRPYQ